jgi:hypothetical protein
MSNNETEPEDRTSQEKEAEERNQIWQAFMQFDYNQ